MNTSNINVIFGAFRIPFVRVINVQNEGINVFGKNDLELENA